MLFEFERFTAAAKMAYRRCGGSAYSIEDVLHVFKYYFETYEMVFDAAHPMINISQIAGIIREMPYLNDGSSAEFDVSVNEYELMIDQHFITRYRDCDYNINHFFSGKIRYMRFFEACY